MKKAFPIVFIVIIFVLVSCTGIMDTDKTHLPVELRLFEIFENYNLEDFTSYGYWVINFKEEILDDKLRVSDVYFLKVNEFEFEVLRNSVDNKILMIYIPENFSKSDIENGVLKCISPESSFHKRETQGIKMEKLIIKRAVMENEIDLYELKVTDYVDLKVAGNAFVFQNDVLIRPSYVKSNEENVYTMKCYIDAKQITDAHDVNAAFVFLKESSEHESALLFFGNPNRVHIENGSPVISEPDTRDRVRQLGEMGNISESATYTYDIDDDTVASEITLSFKRENFSNERYRKSIEFKIQIKEATVCLFSETSPGIFETLVQYATTNNTELIKNARFTSRLPSTNTNIRLISGDKKTMRMPTQPATVLKVASGTTAEELIVEIASVDGRKQRYRLYDDSGTLTAPDVITSNATLNVESEWGEEYMHEYSVLPIDTYFVRLEKSGVFSWHDTIQEAVNVASNDSTITVYAGEYRESVDMGSTTTHLMSENPADVHIREKTIINAVGKSAAVIVINGSSGNNSVVEGFTITTGSSNGYPGIYIGNVYPIIRYNSIINNTNDCGGGIYVKNSNNVSTRDGLNTIIHNNLIEDNSAVKGGGIYLGTGLNVQIYDNEIKNNNASNSGGGIYVGQGTVVKNKSDVLWNAELLPGTVDAIEKIENTEQTNIFDANSINSDINAESATIYFTRTISPSENDVIAHSYGKWVRLYGDHSSGDLMRLFTYEASSTEVASETYSGLSGSRLSEKYIEIGYDVQENTEYFVTLQKADINRNVQSTKVSTIAIDTPDIATLVSPASGTYFLSIPVTFDWNAADDAVSYNLCLGKNPSNLSVFVADIIDTQYATDALEELGEYYWQVESVDRYGVAKKSEMRTFVTHSTAFAGGDGTEGNPFQIATPEQLNSIRENCLGNTKRGYYFKQTADVDLSTYSNWDPIGGVFGDGTSERCYSHYDGDGFKITNLTVNRSSEYYGGFISILYGTVKNVRLIDCFVKAKNQTGAVVGTNAGIVENCAASGTVSGPFYIGGIVGANNATVKLCHFQGTVNSDNHAGGLIGLNQGTIENCYARASAESSDNFAGGLVAYTDRGSITNCFSTGKVSAKNSKGGMVGSNSGCSITNSFWDKETSGLTSSDGGTGKTTLEMKTGSTFTDASWEFSTIWAIEGSKNNGYPYLRTNEPF